MKYQLLFIPDYDWLVDIYYDATPSDAMRITKRIADLGCAKYGIYKVYAQLASGILNNGFTYTNKYLRQSVMSLGRASSFAQFLNSFVHELHHLCTHIAMTYRLDLQGEDVCYLAGDIAQMMHPVLLNYISNCRI